jgi:response regulator NasT
MADPAPAAESEAVPRVVIAEDEAIIRLDLRETLVEAGYEVVAEAASGEPILAAVGEHGADVALVDINMPGMDGIELTERLTRSGVCAVVVVTAFGQRDLIQKARDAGALGYIVKPFDKRDLVPAIEIALGRFAELQTLRGRAGELEERLETRKLVDRAKGILMDSHAMTEAQAFRFLQTGAMQRRDTMAAVASAVIEGAVSPPQ